MQIVEETIKGQKYRLLKLSPLEGGRLATLVARQLAGALDGDSIKELMQGYARHKEGEAKEGTEAEAKPKNPLAMLMDNSAMLSALAGGIARLDADGLYESALKCIRGGNLFADAKLHDENALNVWFDQHPDHLLLVLVWALRVNCAGFFGLGAKA